MNITNEHIIEYTDNFYKPVSEKLRELRNVEEKGGIPIIRKDTESLIISLLYILKPQRILEIGTGGGYSATVMATVCPKSTILTVEKDPRAVRRASSNFDEADLSHRVSILQGDGRKVISDLTEKRNKKELKPFDFIFIDAAKSHYMGFFNESIKVSHAGTLILCDNILLGGITADERYLKSRRDRTSMNRMKEFLEYIKETDKGDTFVLPMGDGVSLTYVK